MLMSCGDEELQRQHSDVCAAAGYWAAGGGTLQQPYHAVVHVIACVTNAFALAVCLSVTAVVCCSRCR
jgi:hypothetical protein